VQVPEQELKNTTPINLRAGFGLAPEGIEHNDILGIQKKH
jgi:hypothetical protein